MLSCDIVGRVRDPDTPRMETPLLMFDAMILFCSAVAIVTDPPVVYPDGIDTEPAFVEIVPDVEPLFGIPPEIDPLAPKAVLPVSKSALAAVAPAVS